MKKARMIIGTIVILLIAQWDAHALCVNVTEANLRTGPGIKYDKSWEVFKYMPFEKITKKGNWYKVRDVDGDVHWIYKKLVTGSFQCAVVKKDKSNIRSGPGTKYSKKFLSPAIKYDAFKVLKKQKSWVNVIDEFGDTGWIYRNLVWIR